MSWDDGALIQAFQNALHTHSTTKEEEENQTQGQHSDQRSDQQERQVEKFPTNFNPRLTRKVQNVQKVENVERVQSVDKGSEKRRVFNSYVEDKNLDSPNAFERKYSSNSDLSFRKIPRQFKSHPSPTPPPHSSHPTSCPPSIYHQSPAPPPSQPSSLSPSCQPSPLRKFRGVDSSVETTVVSMPPRRLKRKATNLLETHRIEKKSRGKDNVENNMREEINSLKKVVATLEKESNQWQSMATSLLNESVNLNVQRG
eukprot:g3829.t1